MGSPPFIDYSLILYSQMTKNQLVKILSLTEFGFTEILCDGDSQGKINELLGRSIEQVGTLELESFLLKNYEFLKQSILGGGRSLQTGFSEEKKESSYLDIIELYLELNFYDIITYLFIKDKWISKIKKTSTKPASAVFLCSVFFVRPFRQNVSISIELIFSSFEL